MAAQKHRYYRQWWTIQDTCCVRMITALAAVVLVIPSVTIASVPQELPDAPIARAAATYCG
jgi:hypothetical protein